MKRLLYYSLLLLTATYLGLLLQQHPGYLFIQTNEWTIRLPLWLAIISLVTLFSLLYMLWHLYFTLFHRQGTLKYWYQQYKQKKSQALQSQGLLFLWLGDFRKAEKYLLAKIPNNDHAIIHYLAATKAAQRQKKYHDCQNYLNEAKQNLTYNNQYHHLAIDVMNAYLLIEQQQYNQALTILNKYQGVKPSPPISQLMLYLIYYQKKDWQHLLPLIPTLYYQGLMNKNRYQVLMVYVYRKRLNQLTTLAEIKACWHIIATDKSLQCYSADFVYPYIKAWLASKEDYKQELLELIWRTFKEEKTLDPRLLNLIHQFKQLKTATLLEKTESLLTLYPNDINLLLILAKMAICCQLWGKAMRFLNKSIAIKPTTIAYVKLANIYQSIGNKIEADQAYSKAIAIINHSFTV